MGITLQKLQERLEQLKKDLAEAQMLAANLSMQIYATQGAIQDCEHWIKVFSEEKSDEKK